MAKVHLFKPSNPAGHKVYALFFAAIMILSVVGISLIFQAMDSDTAVLTGHSSVTSMVSQTWGWNGTKWIAALMTSDPATYSFTASFPDGFAVKTVYIVTANSSFNAEHLLENSLIYQNTKVALTYTTGANATLNAVYSYVGSFTNSTATSSFNDKAITQSVINQTLYSGSSNSLGLAVEYPILGLFNTIPASTPLWQIDLASHANSTGSISITFTSFLSSSYNFNLIVFYAETIAVIFLISAVITMLYQHPKHRGD